MNGLRNETEAPMRQHLHTRTAVFLGGALLALTACDHADTIVDVETNEFISTAPTESGNDKASLFRVPRETRVLLLARP